MKFWILMTALLVFFAGTFIAYEFTGVWEGSDGAKMGALRYVYTGSFLIAAVCFGLLLLQQEQLKRLFEALRWLGRKFR